MAGRTPERVVRGKRIDETRSAGAVRARCVATQEVPDRVVLVRSGPPCARFEAGGAFQAIEWVVTDDHAVGADAIDHVRDAIGVVVAIRLVGEQPRAGAVDLQRVEASRIGVVARRGHDATSATPTTDGENCYGEQKSNKWG